MGDIKQIVTFNASPIEVYDVLMDSHKHAHFTGDSAEISKEVGGKFKTYGGFAEGENLELIPGKLIVQTWRASDWPIGHYSTIRFEFKEVFGVGGKIKTKLTFTQENVPEDFYSDIDEGWKQFYWNNMKNSFRW